MNRICVFAHYDRDNMVDQYVLRYLEGLRKVTQHIIFVSTSRLGAHDIKVLERVCGLVITRENVGYDFMSWQVGLESVTDIASYDELILCNDSVYGPLYPLDKIFDKMAKRACDFWGITADADKAFHLQSYFLVFRKNLMATDAFKSFWRSIIPEQSKKEIIEKYEIGLTDTLVKQGFKPAVLISYTPSFPRHLWSMRKPWSFKKCLWLFIVAPLSGIIPRWKNMAPPSRKFVNTTYVYWSKLVIHRKMPFLKIDLLRTNPTGTRIDHYARVLGRYSDYEVSHIVNHLKRMNEEAKGVSSAGPQADASAGLRQDTTVSSRVNYSQSEVRRRPAG